jgi:hypothetical protein
MLNRKYLFTMDYDDFIDAENSRESSLFDMNYKDYRVDGNPETDMLLGKRWIVKADISNCFLSIYSHSLAWALVGKDEAKANRDDAHWYNKIDILSRNVKDGETNGLPIGPHTSNLLSEIILIAIDNELHNGNNCWDYVRNIDDYTCYVDNREKAELFLTELNKQLSYYNLSLNHKKTEILELPIANTAHWTRQMEYLTHFERNGKLDYKSARSYLDVAIELMDKNDSNSSILKYAIKVLSNQNNFTDNAKAYIAKTMMNLSIIYPYLVSLLDECVFIPFAVDEEVIGKYCDVMLKSALRSCNYEAAAYCAYFSVKYGFTLADLNADVGIKSAVCILLTMLFLYFKTTKSESNINVLKQHAKSLINTDFDEYWIFVYESLSANDLPEHLSEWKDLKNHNVSFIRSL